MKSDYMEQKALLDNTKVFFLITFSICKHLQKLQTVYDARLDVSLQEKA